MNNKSISLNEPYETTNQQLLNLSNIFINIKNKEYQENIFDIEKNNSSKIIKYLKKSDDLESFLDCKNLIINPNKSFFNINDYSIKTKAAIIQRLKIEKEENKEEEKEEHIKKKYN